MFIGWIGGLLTLLLAYLYIGDWFRSKRCQRHGVFGRCGRCEEETAARARAGAEAKAETECQRLDIEETYRSMDETLRNELTAIVLERAEREHLMIRSDDLEAAVVRIYRRSKQLTTLVAEHLGEEGDKRRSKAERKLI
jgi:hypothetical protein